MACTAPRWGPVQREGLGCDRRRGRRSTQLFLQAGRANDRRARRLHESQGFSRVLERQCRRQRWLLVSSECDKGQRCIVEAPASTNRTKSVE